ncbi:MAG TPA: hypothetical protein VFP61_05385 [Acidimicrobiales bacterium]|nr:hypothetical protein [Acidimicrobiales bacterium]
MTPAWCHQRDEGPPADLHRRSAGAVAAPTRRTVRELVPTGTAVVLGSAQRPSDVDAGRVAGRGWTVARRRSGGAAVLVGPGQCRWVDVVVPAGDPLWEPDVGLGALWVGRAWVSALATAGLEAEVWNGPMRASPWSRLVCFAGLAPGEVTVEGRKVVGVAQRRTRAGTLLQCALLERWAPAELLDVLALDPGARSTGAGDLAEAAMGVGDAAGTIVDALLAELP